MLPSHSEIERITINDILDIRTAVLNSALRPDAMKTLGGGGFVGSICGFVFEV